MMLQPGVICPAVWFYDAGGYTLTLIRGLFCGKTILQERGILIISSCVLF